MDQVMSSHLKTNRQKSEFSNILFMLFYAEWNKKQNKTKQKKTLTMHQAKCIITTLLCTWVFGSEMQSTD